MLKSATLLSACSRVALLVSLLVPMGACRAEEPQNAAGGTPTSRSEATG
jgi:hypothetical protein